MPPTPKAPPSMPESGRMTRSSAVLPGEEIVVSGYSGKFPNSKNVEEFKYNLYNKVS